MKNMSKFLLAGILVLSMAVPTFADVTAPIEATDGTPIETVGGGETGQEVEGAGTVELPMIKVTLPSSHGFIVNPYNLESAGQVVSAEATIKNESDIAVKVSLKSAVATLPGEGKLKATLGPVTAKTITKTVELNLVVTTSTGTLHAPVTGVPIVAATKATDLVTLDKTTGEAVFTYEGKAVANPVGNPWDAGDTITLASVYTFAPVAAE